MENSFSHIRDFVIVIKKNPSPILSRKNWGIPYIKDLLLIAIELFG